MHLIGVKAISNRAKILQYYEVSLRFYVTFLEYHSYPNKWWYSKKNVNTNTRQSSLHLLRPFDNQLSLARARAVSFSFTPTFPWGVANGKSETCWDAETGTLKSETEMEKFSDLIEKQMCDQQTQNLRLWDPLLGSARFQDLSRICRDFLFFRGPLTTPSFARQITPGTMT